MKHIFKNRQGETIVEVLVSFLLLMIFTSMFVVSLRYARAMSQKAETLRETAYAFCAGCRCIPRPWMSLQRLRDLSSQGECCVR